MNIYKDAVINKLRITVNGSTFLPEDLRDLPLQSKNGLSLDSTAIALNNQIKALETKSFVSPNNTDITTKELKLAFELVLDAIQDKQADSELKRDAKAKSTKRDRLDALIAEKMDSVDKEKSLEELQKERDSL